MMLQLEPSQCSIKVRTEVGAGALTSPTAQASLAETTATLRRLFRLGLELGLFTTFQEPGTLGGGLGTDVGVGVGVLLRPASATGTPVLMNWIIKPLLNNEAISAVNRI